MMSNATDGIYRVTQDLRRPNSPRSVTAPTRLRTPDALLRRLNSRPDLPTHILQLHAAVHLELSYAEAQASKFADRASREKKCGLQLQAPLADNFYPDKSDIFVRLDEGSASCRKRATGKRPPLLPKSFSLFSGTAPTPTLSIAQVLSDAPVSEREPSSREGVEKAKRSSYPPQSPAQALERWLARLTSCPPAHAAAQKLSEKLLPKLFLEEGRRLVYRGHLTIDAKYKHLVNLPSRLTIEGNFSLRDLPDFVAFGRKTRIYGDLLLMNLPRLVELPGCIGVNSLRISNCPGIECFFEHDDLSLQRQARL